MFDTKHKIVTVTGISKKGKQRVKQSGSRWVQLSLRNEVGFKTDTPGPWAFIHAIDGNDVRWVDIHADKHFTIQEE